MDKKVIFALVLESFKVDLKLTVNSDNGVLQWEEFQFDTAPDGRFWGHAKRFWNASLQSWGPAKVKITWFWTLLVFSRHKDELSKAKELNGLLQSKLNEREKQVFTKNLEKI